MKTLLKKPASLLAILVMALTMALALSACSEGGGDPDPDPDELGVCVVKDKDIDTQMCVALTRAECSVATETFGLEDISFGTACPAGYDNSVKGCSFSYNGKKYCSFDYGAGDCSDYFDGTMKDAGLCLREAEAFITGSCLEYDYEEEREICTPNASKMFCSGIFTKDAKTCPTSPIGSCSYSYEDYFDCQDNVSQIMCYDDFVAGGTCPLGSCRYFDYDTWEPKCEENVSQSLCYDNYEGSFYSSPTCPAKYCAYEEYDDEDDEYIWFCEKMIPGTDRVQNAQECRDEYNGDVIFEEDCELYGAEKYSPLSSPKKK